MYIGYLSQARINVGCSRHLGYFLQTVDHYIRFPMMLQQTKLDCEVSPDDVCDVFPGAYVMVVCKREGASGGCAQEGSPSIDDNPCMRDALSSLVFYANKFSLMVVLLSHSDACMKAM